MTNYKFTRQAYNTILKIQYTEILNKKFAHFNNAYFFALNTDWELV